MGVCGCVSVCNRKKECLDIRATVLCYVCDREFCDGEFCVSLCCVCVRDPREVGVERKRRQGRRKLGFHCRWKEKEEERTLIDHSSGWGFTMRKCFPYVNWGVNLGAN